MMCAQAQQTVRPSTAMQADWLEIGHLKMMSPCARSSKYIVLSVEVFGNPKPWTLSGTFEAKARDDSVSVACAGEGARLAIMRALALPPRESCSSIVSLEFLQRQPHFLTALLQGFSGALPY